MLNGLSEVQSALYNEDFLENLSKGFFNAYKNFEEHESVNEIEITEVSTAPTREESKNFISKIVDFFYEILKTIIDVLKELYYRLKEILPLIFDKFIESLLLYSKKTKKQLYLSFKQIFDIFQLFGLEEIYPETFDKINAALQWKICSVNWIDSNFLNIYKNSLLSNTSVDVINAINDLRDLLEMLKKESENNVKFEEDLARILDY
ncbi:hypothetical protein ES705_30172 [subsurface metagenome]